MNAKSMIWLGMFVGSTVGGLVPGMWGAGFLSLSGLVCSSLGAFAGIWLGYKAGTSL